MMLVKTRNDLMRRWRSLPSADARFQFYDEQIRPFSRENPDFRITRSNLIRSIKEARRREREVEKGRYSNYRSIHEYGSFYNVPE